MMQELWIAWFSDQALIIKQYFALLATKKIVFHKRSCLSTTI